MRSFRRLDSTKPSSARNFSRIKLYGAVLAASQWIASGQVWAGPEGGQVVGGEGIIQQAGVETIITQATERMAIDWRSFDVAANERVEFIQPSASSIALNRVLSNRGSEILGRIDANGQVMLVNPNGVIFGKDSIVNVGGMIASGLNIDPQSFINGDFTLNSIEGAEGKVINYGIINAATGGSVTLVGEQVQNDGLISAKLGAVNLVAGNAAVLTFDPSGMIGVRVTEAVVQNELGVDAAVINNGTINAEGGRVLLSASVSEDIFSNAVNNGGMNRESSVVVHEDGSFTLGAGGDLINTGDISVSTIEGNAGQVVALGNNITHSGSITADTAKGSGGSIEIHSTDTTLLTENSTLSAQATAQGQGGDVKVLGNKVGLFDHAEVNASGANGGGQVLIGGDKTGANKKIRNADFIYLDEDSTVKTNALVNGDGGKLITFASDTARIYGNLYSRGGTDGGNGGFIETSGLRGFEILDTPDITAMAGSGGTWLVDPYNIEIVAGNQTSDDFSAPNTSPFTSSATQGPRLSVVSIVNALVNGSTVIVQTGGSATPGNLIGGDAGNITLSGALNFNFSDKATLRLLAHNNINLDNSIGAATRDSNNNPINVTGTLNLELIANKDNLGNHLADGGGSITIKSGQTISTNGGYFYAGKSAQEDADGRLDNDYTNKVFNFTSDGTISTYGSRGGGDIVINATNDVSLGAVEFGYDYLRANSYTNDTITQDLVRVGSVTINSSGGNVTLNSEINFNNTGKRRGNGSSGFASGIDPSSEETFLKIDAFGNITIKGLISDAGYGDARDSLNIELTADKGNSNTDPTKRGAITIDADIYTAGGNFTASGYAFNSLGRMINTDRANASTSINIDDPTTETLGNGRVRGIANGNALNSNGGNIIISAESTASIGSLVTDVKSTTGTRSGNLIIQGVNRTNGISTDNVTVSQDGVWKVAGTSTFNTGTGGNITLEKNNIFYGDLLFASADTVKLTAVTDPENSTDTTAITFGNSDINGALTLKSGGNISQTGHLKVTEQTTIALSSNSADKKNVNLSNAANDFKDRVTVTNAANLSLRDVNDLSVGALTTSGNIVLQAGLGTEDRVILNGNINTKAGDPDDKNITLRSKTNLANDITIDAGAGAISIEGTINSNAAKDLTLTGSNITLTGDVLGLGDVVVNSSAKVSIGSSNIEAISFSVSGAGEEADSLELTKGKNNWLVNGVNSGEIQKLDDSPASPLITFTGIKNLLGGSGDDDFVIGQSGSIASIKGGTGVSTLTGRNANNTWEITGNNQGVLKQGTTTYVSEFTNIKNLKGGSAVDTFDFSFSANAAITGSIDGGGVTGNNTIKGRNAATTWTVTDINAGNVGATGSTYIQSFNNIQNLTGGTAADIFDFTAADAKVTGVVDGGANGSNAIKARTGADNTWLMLTNDSGSLGITGAATTYIDNFKNIQVFTGAGHDTMSYEGFSGSGPISLTLGATGSTGVTSFIGNDIIDATITKTNGTNTWIITGANQGTVNGFAFSKFKNLQGGSGNDTFDFSNPNSKITGTVNGGGANDKIIARTGVTNTWLMTGSNSGSVAQTDADPEHAETYINQFTDIEAFQGAGSDIMSFASVADAQVQIGSASASGITKLIGGTNSTIIGDNKENLWKINGANSGEIDTYTFENFANITGGSGKDTFTFSGTGSISGTLDGAGGSDTLVAKNLANIWNFTNAGTKSISVGASSYVANFTGIETLQGGSGIDVFNLFHDFTGAINGGSGNDEFNINSSVTGTLNAGAGTNTFKINATVNTLVGGEGDDYFVFGASGKATSIDGGLGTNRITARDGKNTWNLNVTDGGNIQVTDGEIYLDSFTNIQNLVGGNDVDIFRINKHFNGSLFGGAGNDSFRFDSVNNEGAVLSIDGQGGVNELMGRNSPSTWTINSANAGTVSLTSNADGIYVTSFSNIQSLVGGSAADIFEINAAISNSINAGSGNNTFNINAAVGSLTGGDGNDNFVFKEDGSATNIDGAGGFNTLTAKNLANIWTLTGNNKGSIKVGETTYVTSFENFQILQGGSGLDTFNLNHGFTGEIRGGAGNDRFNVNAAVNELFGEDGNDSFIFSSTNNQGSAHLIDGGEGVNSITGRNTANTWSVSSLNSGALEVTGGSKYVNSFTSIQTLNGGSGDDIFEINANVSNGISAGGGNNTFNVNTYVETLTGGAGNDSFVFKAGGVAKTVNGGGGTNTLVGRNSANTWTLTALNVGSVKATNGDIYVDQFSNIQTLQGGNLVDIFNLNFGFSGTVKGGADADIFNVNAAVNALQGEDGNDSFLFVSDENAGSANSIDGGAGVNSLSGRNQNSTWTISSANTGALESDLDGVYVTGFTNIQTLIGGSRDDNFIIDAEVQNAIDAGAGNNTFTINANVGDITGGESNDTFVFGVNGRASSVSGGGGINTLIGRDGPNTWEIIGTDRGRLGTTGTGNFYVQSFREVQTLQGGNNVDTFRINYNFSGTINGGAGDDIFHINALVANLNGNAGNDEFTFANANNNGIATNIDGGTGNNKLVGRNQDSVWTIETDNSGSVASAVKYVQSFKNIKNIVGGSATDTLEGSNQNTSWTISGFNSGSLHASETPTVSISFEEMENLRGNQAVDTFTFSSTGKISGIVDGGSTDSLNINIDTLDLSAKTGGVSVQLGSQSSSSLNVINIEEIIAFEGATNKLFGASDFDYQWRMTDNGGLIERKIGEISDTRLETSVTFTNFKEITGGTRNDYFEIVSGQSNKKIDGGGGAGVDFADYSKWAGHIDIDLGDNGFGAGIVGIEGVKGNSESGTGTSTIVVKSGNNTWKIGSEDGLANGVNDGSVTINGSQIKFENVTNIMGGSGNDTFNYLPNGKWIGSISGGGGTNKINAEASTLDQHFVLNGTSTDTGTKIAFIQELLGNVATNSKLTSAAGGNTWNIGRTSDETTVSGMKFWNIANLQGGSFVDIFNIYNLDWLTGVIDGGGGDALDTVNLGGLNRDVSVSIDGLTSADIKLVNVESINANERYVNTLKGDLINNKWHINAVNSGFLAKTLDATTGRINFTNFANLLGGDADDVVKFVNNGAMVTGQIDLGVGQDLLDLTAVNRDFTVQINSTGSAVAQNVISVSNTEEVKGAANRSNRLIADNYDNAWVIDNLNAGRVTSSEAGTVAFSGFANLTGGNKDDLFAFEALGEISGLVDGGAHVNRDTIDLSKSNNADVVIASNGGVSGYINIEKYIGNNIDSIFTASNGNNNWVLTGSNRGTLNSTIEFENFGTLKGGAGQDNFIIDNATISGFIDSGDGDDSFDIKASSIAEKISAGAGDDRFLFTIVPGFEGMAIIDGGSGTNRLTVEGGDSGYNASHQPGSLEYVSANNNTYSIFYSNVNNIFDNVVANTLSIFGTASADVLRLQTARYSTNDLAMINYANKANIAINGSADDLAIVDGTVSVESTVTFNNVQINAENSGKIQARSLVLVNTGDVGSSASRLNTAVVDLSLNTTNGKIFLEEQDGLRLKDFNVSTTDLIDIRVGSSLESSGALSYTGILSLESLRGNIDLGVGNALTGTLNLKAAGNISLGSSQSLAIGDFSAQNANLASEGSIRGSGVFSVAGLATLAAGTDISLINAGNDLNQITITNADTADIFDRNGFTSVGLNVASNLKLRSSGNITVGTNCTTDCANRYGINTNNLEIQSDSSVTLAKNILAAENVSIRSQGITVNDSVTSKQIAFNSGNGKLLLNEGGNLFGGSSINLTANTVEQRSTVQSDGDIRVIANGDMVMAERAVIETSNGNINLDSGNLQLATVKAENGSVIMNIQGAITDGNGGAVNVIANRWQADALNGIGTGLGRVGNADAIETDVNILSLRNAGRLQPGMANSSINIANTDSITIEQLRNNGDIGLSTLTGEIVLDNTHNEVYNPTLSDARLQGGVINTNAGLLSQLQLNSGNGMVRAENKANKNNPDIISDVATFTLSQAYDFGERNRRIVMHIPESYAQIARYSFVAWYLGKPKLVTDLSQVPPDSLVSGSDQLIQIEALSDIDPAVFTNLRNYLHDEIAILLPIDQRFDDEDAAF